MLLLNPFRDNIEGQNFMHNKNSAMADTEYLKEYFDLTGTIAQAFELDKAVIAEKVFAREIIADTYLNCLDEARQKLAFEYNAQTAKYKQSFTAYAIDIFHGFYDLEIAPDYLDRPIQMSEFVSRTARHSLHKNASALIYGDPFLSTAISFEIGGSYGAWPEFIHENTNDAESLENYFTLADNLARACLSN